jgi:hypothetical protein
MENLQQILGELFVALWRLFLVGGALVLQWALLIAWIAWCLWAVDWRKMWPRLAEGAWAPLVLLALMISAVWSWIAPSSYSCLGVMLPNFAWQLLAVGLIVGLGLFCGWLQLVLRWHPAGLDVDAAPAHGDDHGHGHGEHGHESHEPEPHASHGH